MKRFAESYNSLFLRLVMAAEALGLLPNTLIALSYSSGVWAL